MAFVLKKSAKPGDPIGEGRDPVPPAPGGNRSPQVPGQVPDRSSIPEHGQLPVSLPSVEVRRPRTEYGSAQRIMGVYGVHGENADDPARFEQATASYEEIRKANPALRTPVRPTPGYALAEGTRIAHPATAALAEGANTEFVDE